MEQAGARGNQVRQFAFGAIRNLADESSNRKAIWTDEGAKAALIGVCLSPPAGDAVSPKRALKTLCALTYEASNAADMWADATGARAALVQAAKSAGSSGDMEISLCGLRSLQAMSVEATTKTSMWADAGVREALLGAAKLLQAEACKLRICALSTLKNLTTEADNMEGIWGDSSARDVLVVAAQEPAPEAAKDATMGRARAVGLGAMRNVAMNNANKEPMWSDEQSRRAILSAAKIAGEDLTADQREAREHGIAALRHLAVPDGPGQSAPLWKNNDDAKAALNAAAQLTTEEQTDRKARDYAVAALRFAL